MTGFYGPALSRVQAEALSPATLEAVPFLAELVGNKGAAFDVGCSDGTLLAGLRSRGLSVKGCDLSEDMVDLARSRGLPVTRGDARAVAFPPSDLILAIGEVLCFRDEAGDSLKALPRMAHALNPGGALVFDVMGPNVGNGRGWIDDGPHGGNWHCSFAFERDGWQITRHTHVFTREGDAWYREVESHVMTICPPAVIENTLRASGLSVSQVKSYGAYSLAPGRVGFIARKPG